MDRATRRSAASKSANVEFFDKEADFSIYIKFWREQVLRISQQELGRSASTSGAYICMIEKGDKLPSDKFCVKLARAIGRPPKEVIEWVKKTREKMLLAEAELQQKQVSAEQYNEDINRFLDAYKKLDVREKRLVEVMISQFTTLLETRRSSAT